MYHLLQRCMMVSLILSLIILFAGYLLYGRFAERVFAPDDRITPANAIHDGVDCVPLKTPKALLIQLLNIAGTGPIFGALMGAVFGPRVFLWIVFGSVLGGAVHDYMTGMISCRNSGASIAEMTGKYLGKGAKYVMRVFSLVLLLLFGTVFVSSPAELLNMLTRDVLGETFWTVIILIYYILATLLPIDKVIGRLYPLFGIVLILMAVCITGGIMFGGYTVPEIWSSVGRPDDLPTWPFMFITVACGAISGFHATQSPMVAKCITSEKNGRVVFYGAMIIEAVIALVWAVAGVSYYGTTALLKDELAALGQSGVVYDISSGLLGTFGGVLAIVGVVICPISSGDTAFRAARLTLAEWFRLPQDKIKNRLLLTVPLLGAGAILTTVNFDIIWRYASWSNQTLAMIALWTYTVYLVRNGKGFKSLICAIPAAFMSAVCLTYILMAQEGFRLSGEVSYPIGILFAAGSFTVYAVYLVRYMRSTRLSDSRIG